MAEGANRRQGGLSCSGAIPARTVRSVSLAGLDRIQHDGPVWKRPGWNAAANQPRMPSRERMRDSRCDGASVDG